MSAEPEPSHRDAAQADLRDGLRTLLHREWGSEGLRRLLAGDDSSLTRVSALLTDQLSLPSLLSAESGAGCMEAAIAMEELGRGLLPFDVLPIWMADAVSGDVAPEGLRGRTALVWPGADVSWAVDQVDVPVVSAGRLHGLIAAAPMPDSAVAVLLPASAERRYTAALVQRDDVGLRLRPVRSADSARPLVDLVADGAAVRMIALEDPHASFCRALAFGATCLGAEMVGAAQHCLDAAVAYARTRVQFRQPIGRFQAVRHGLADVYTGLCAARSSVYRAAAAMDAPDDGSEVLLARIAKVRASTALKACAEAAIQVHGGIGFTWELPLHLALKKWGTAANLYGSEYDQRIAILRAVGR